LLILISFDNCTNIDISLSQTNEENYIINRLMEENASIEKKNLERLKNFGLKYTKWCIL
jgi:hypothetical protein